jgi:hypothetical protein
VRAIARDGTDFLKVTPRGVDAEDMSDLSRMLDDLYALPSTDGDDGLEPELAKAPAWSSDEALDEVFSSWIPGPTEDATSTQRALVAAATTEPLTVAPVVDDWLIESAPEPAPDPEPATLVEVTPERPLALVPWVPSDDDILPPRRARGRSRGKHARP